MKSQRGNIIVYLLVGVVLFGVLLGSIWWVKSRYTMAQPVQQTEQTATAPEVSQDDTSSNPAKDESEESSQTTNQPAQSAPANGSSAQAPATNTPNTGPSRPSPNSVAASGPTENFIVSAALLGLITYQTSSFLRSRQARS